MKVIFAGTPQNAAQTLVALTKSGVEVVGVLTRTDALVGRNKVLTPSAVAVAADQLGIPVIKTNDIDQDALDQIQKLSADLGVVVAYGAFLNDAALKALPQGWVNLHYSLLPKLRGAAPVQHALLEGALTTGVSVFQLEKGMDTGPLFIQVPTAIEPGENAGRLLERLTHIGISALLEILPSIAAGIATATEQNHSDATFAPKISRDQAKIDWSRAASDIERLVFAMNPEPVAWTTLNQQNVRILDARADKASAAGTGPHGQVQIVDDLVLVTCGDDCLVIEIVQPAGKNPMTARDWYRGQQDKGNLVLGS